MALGSDVEFPLPTSTPPLLAPHRERLPLQPHAVMLPGCTREDPAKHLPPPQDTVLPRQVLLPGGGCTYIVHVHRGGEMGVEKS